MAYVIRNKSNRVGEVSVKGQWVAVPPGKSITSDEKPLSLTPNLNFFSVPVVGSPSRKDKDGKDKKGEEKGGLNG